MMRSRGIVKHAALIFLVTPILDQVSCILVGSGASDGEHSSVEPWSVWLGWDRKCEWQRWPHQTRTRTRTRTWIRTTTLNILADIPLAAPIMLLTPLAPSTYLNRGCVAVDMLVQRAQKCVLILASKQIPLVPSISLLYSFARECSEGFVHVASMCALRARSLARNYLSVCLLVC